MIEKSFETGEAEGGILNGIENAERYEADIRTMKSTWILVPIYYNEFIDEIRRQY